MLKAPQFWTFNVIAMVDICTDHEKLSIFFFSNTDGHFWWCFLGNYIYLFTIINFLTKRYIDGGRHLKSNVQDGGDSIIVRTAKYTCFAVYNRRQNCWDIVLKWDNLEEQNNTHSSPIPSIEGWGVSCFQQVARTAAQRCMEGVGRERSISPPLKLARRQTSFVADCREIARERKRKKYNAIITLFPSLIEHSSWPISVWKIALLL